MASSGRAISQQAFDDLVTENMEDLGMDPDEALQDAIQTLNLQGVDLSEGTDNASIAARNGGVELLNLICAALDGRHEKPLVSALKAMSSILRDVQSTEEFRKTGGPKIVVDILNESRQFSDLLDSGFAIVAAAATGNEVLKESFMNLKTDELIADILREQSKDSAQSLYDAIRVLLTPDDNRVVASQVYGYARRFAKIGIANALVDALREGLSSSSLLPACFALKAVAVNICKFIKFRKR